MASPSSGGDNAPMAFSGGGDGASGAGSLPNLGIMDAKSGGESSFQGVGGMNVAPAPTGGPSALGGGGPSALTQSGSPVGGQGSDATGVPVGGGSGNGPVI